MKIEVELPNWLDDEETLAENVANRIAILAHNDIRAEVKTAIKARVTEQVHVLVDAAVHDAVNQDFHLTNAYGERKGETTTLREMVMEMATKRIESEVDAKTGGPTKYNQPKCSLAAYMVNSAVKTAISNDLKTIESKVKDQAIAAMAAHLAKDKNDD